MHSFIWSQSEVPDTAPQTKMFDKAFIVLSLCVLLFRLGVDGEVITASSSTGLESASTDKVFCPEEVVDGQPYGEFIFPRTEATVAGTIVKVDCTHGFRDDGFQPIYDGQWQTLESKIAESGAVRKCVIRESVDGSIVGRWEPSAEDLQILRCKHEGWEHVLRLWNHWIEVINSANFRNAYHMMPELLYYAYEDYECALAFINGVDLLLRSPVLSQGVISKEERVFILNLVNLYAENMRENLRSGYKLQVGDGGIIIETAKLENSKYLLFKNANTDHNISNTDFGPQAYVTNFSMLNETDIRIDISSEALQMGIKQAAGKDPYIQISMFSEDILNWSGESSVEGKRNLDLLGGLYNETVVEDCESTNDNNTDYSNPYRSLGLLSIELEGEIQNLTEPIAYMISGNAPCGHKMTCVYWDTTSEKWSTDGIDTLNSDNGVTCKSTHLTAFSALIEPLPLPFPGAEYAPVNNSIHGFILSILSSIGSVCSIVGLSFTLLTYGLFRSLRRERSNRILINLSASLLLMHIMSMSGSKDLWDGYCFFPAASLHYLVLTSLAWMMVEAVHMFELLISVFVRPENRFLIKRFVLAWGIPLIIVGVCTSVEPEVYRVGRADLCLMSAHANIVLYYAAYIGPICIMLLVNIIIFGRIFRVLYQQTKRTNGTKSGPGAPTRYQFVKISPSQIKGATTVLVLLGIGWTLGLLAMGPFEVLFRYLYCICNAGQGLFIFIFRVLLNPHASKQWKKVILGLSPDSSMDVSVTTSTTTGLGRGKKRQSDTISPTYISASNSVENSLTPSNPLSMTLAKTLASILRSEDARAAGSVVEDKDAK